MESFNHPSRVLEPFQMEGYIFDDASVSSSVIRKCMNMYQMNTCLTPFFCMLLNYSFMFALSKLAY